MANRGCRNANAKAKALAHQLAATGEWNLADIARKVGVGTKTISRWLTPQEKARMPVHRARRKSYVHQWTPEAIAELASKSVYKTAKELAQEYKVCRNQITEMLRKNGYPPAYTPQPSRRYSDEDLAMIDACQKSGQTWKEIASKFNASPGALRVVLYWYRRISSIKAGVGR